MNETNPYEPPEAEVADPQERTPATEQVASGQKLVIYALLLYLAAILLQLLIGDLAALLFLAVLVMSLIGVVRIGSGLGYGVGSRVVLVIAMFLPLVNLITLLLLNARAIRRLRAAGYRVGFFGVSRSPAG